MKYLLIFTLSTISFNAGAGGWVSGNDLVESMLEYKKIDSGNSNYDFAKVM